MKKNRYILAFLSVCIISSHLFSIQSKKLQIPVPEPKYKVRIDRSVMIPMRDGVRLSTDLYFPLGAEDKLPVILIRTPYNKKEWRDSLAADAPAFFARYYGVASMFAAQGYIVAVQDIRGKFESEGIFTVSANDRKDGYDTITWLAQQPWSTGKIGTYGCSYRGECQVQLAAMRHPNHVTMIPQCAGGIIRYFGVKNFGAFELMIVPWFRNEAFKVNPRLSLDLPRELYLKTSEYFDFHFTGQKMGVMDLVGTLPVIDMLKKAGSPPTDFEDFVSHEVSDPWWDKLGYITEKDRFDIPALHISAWYDPAVGDTIQLIDLMRRNSESDRGRDNQFLIVAPTVHCKQEVCAAENTITGQRILGDSRFDFYGTYVRWFDYWLKGIDNGVTRMPKCQVFVMGKNTWRTEDQWPPPQMTLTKHYLHSDGRANSRFGDGTLTAPPPVKDEKPDYYFYDPKYPVPTVGGPMCATRDDPDALPGAFDQSEVEVRNDVLVYTSPQLDRGIEIGGEIEVVLYVSSSAKDTDFTAKLIDVYPDGRAFNLQTGILRARYREGLDKKVWMEPGKVYCIKIWLQATCNFFAPGHRIRVDITSSSFPRFDRNMNTGGNNYDEVEGVVAKNGVHHTAQYPSHIVLPVIEREGQ